MGESENDGFKVHDIFVRKENNFIQGFYYDATVESFVESTGLYGQSKVQWLKQDPDDDRILEIDDSVNPYDLDKSLFGEGLCPRNEEEFVVLTWKEKKIIVLDRETLELNGDDMTVKGDFVVQDQSGNPVKQVNEIQYVDDAIFGNIWYKDVIVKINPSTGVIEKEWDISKLK